LRLTPFRPSRPAQHFRPRANVNLGTDPSTMTPDSRCRHLRPRVMTRLTPRTSAVATFSASSLPKGTRFSQVRLVSALSAEHEFGEVTTDAPCRPLRFGWFPNHPQENQDSFRPSRANGWSFPNPERLPSAGPTEPRSLLALRTLPRGPPLIPWFRHQGPASDMLSRTTLCARPKSLAGYSPESPEPHAAYRLLQLRDPRAHQQAA
jgi:hypothetical protein